MSAISTMMINKITPLKLHLASRTAQSGIINSSLINHGWLTNLFITNTLLNSSHLSTANFSMPNRTGSKQKTPAPPKLHWAAGILVRSGRFWENAHLKVIELHRQLLLGRKHWLNLEAWTPVLLQLKHTPEPSEFIKNQVSDPCLQNFWFSKGRGGGWEFAFLTSPHLVVWKLLVWGPHLENHSSTLSHTRGMTPKFLLYFLIVKKQWKYLSILFLWPCVYTLPLQLDYWRITFFYFSLCHHRT